MYQYQDMDSDGDLDIFMVFSDSPSGDNWQLGWYEHKLDNDFTTLHTFNQTLPQNIDHSIINFAELNGDNQTDIIMAYH